MLRRAARELGVDLSRSWMVGDGPADVGAGTAAGCRTVRVLTGAPLGEEDAPSDFTVAGFAEAAETILAHSDRTG
jgi:phosphoglycolate phosphatase-like HAD superfamily hydrolase